jgi:NADPH:quinone reductase-like Zn-dependent oxidoreductase
MISGEHSRAAPPFWELWLFGVAVSPGRPNRPAANSFKTHVTVAHYNSKGTSTININLLYSAVATVRVIFAGSRNQFIAMNRAITVNGLKPVIDRVFSFDDVPMAFRHSMRGGPLAIVIRH